MLQLVEIVGQVGQGVFETLPLPRVHDDGVGLARGLHRIAGHDLPVIEDALRERLATSVGSQISSESWKKENNTVNKLHHN